MQKQLLVIASNIMKYYFVLSLLSFMYGYMIFFVSNDKQPLNHVTFILYIIKTEILI